jgi:hypothetical protein
VLVVWESSPARQMPSWAVAPPNYLDWQKQNSTFAALAAFMARQVTVTVRGSSARVTAGAVTPNYWAVLGAEPVLGRLPSADADPREIVISDGYWRQSFGASPSALGQTVDVDDQPKTIVGVMPPGVSGSYELWTTLVFSAAERIDRNPHYLGVMGRLKPGVTAEAARADLATIAARLAAAYPETNRDWTIQVCL